MWLEEAFVIHERLNPKLWDDAGKLRPEVRTKILLIVEHFERNLNIPIYIVDVELVGSLCSYNYVDTPEYTSDLDCHIIASFDLVERSKDILEVAYNLKKNEFNKEHNIKINGIEVEMYVLDVNSGITSNGIYSVCDDKWIKQPKPIKSITKHNTEKEFSKWKEHIEAILKRKEYSEILDCINSIYLLRRNSLAVDGEWGKGNALFKDLRSSGLLDKLKSALKDSESDMLSLDSLAENLTTSQIISNLDIIGDL